MDVDSRKSTYESLITISNEGYKFLMFINGGALVAMLAFVGNMVSKNVKLVSYELPFYCFSFGLVACGLAMFFGYLTQLKLLHEKNEIVQFRIAMIFYVLSLLLFVLGCYKSVDVLKNINGDHICQKNENVKN